MPLINTSVSNLIQGVSQQPDSIRYAGQCDVQENALSSVIDGLQKRPSTQFVKRILDGILEEGAKVHFIERDSNERYVVIIHGDQNKTVCAFNLSTGQQATISERYRGTVISAEWTNPSWLDSSSRHDTQNLIVTLSQEVPVVVQAGDSRLTGQNATVVAGRNASDTEYSLISVGADADKKQVVFTVTDPYAFLLSGGQGDTSSSNNVGLGIAGSGGLQSIVEWTLAGASLLSLGDSHYIAQGDSGSTTPKDDIKMLTTGDVTYVLNTKKTVEKDITKTKELDKKALVFIRQGDFSKKYGVEVTKKQATGGFLDSTPLQSFIFSGPSQEKSGEYFYNKSQNANAEVILETLFGDGLDSDGSAVVNDSQGTAVGTNQALNHPDDAASGYHPVGTDADFTSTLPHPLLGTIECTKDFIISPIDSLNGEAVGVIHQSVKSVIDLPNVSPHRFKVKVAGDADEATDDRYVEFVVDASDESTLDGTIGKGYWQETVGPEVENRINQNTMPLVLKSTAENTFELSHIPLDPVMCGDADTNPDPSFVGSKIDGMFQFKSRLGFLSGPSISLSEVKFGSYNSVNDIQSYNFYRTSVVSLLDGDPIDVNIASSSVINLREAVAFQENLILFSDYGQFSLRGGDLLTPKTVAVNPLTEFDYSSSVPPLTVGSYIYFPFQRGDFTGLNEYAVSGSTDVYEANEVTAHVPQYIPKNITAMTASSADEILAMTDGNDIYIYKYFFANKEKVLSSWSKFTMGGNIRGIGFVDSDLYIVKTDEESTFGDNLFDILDPSGQTLLLKLPLETKYRDPEGYNTHLDQRVEFLTADTSLGYPRLVLDYKLDASETIEVYTKDGLLVQGTTTADGTGSDIGKTVVRFNNNTLPAGVSGPFYAGIPYTMKYTFSEQLFTQPTEKGKTPTNSGRMMIRNGTLFFNKTAHFVVKVTPYLRDTSEVAYNSVVVGSSTIGTLPLESAEFRFPVFTNPEKTEITVENSSALPCNLQSAEFESFVHQRSRRYG